MQIKFFKCEHCGNIAVKVFDAGVPLVCCGEKMVELVADSQDAALEKHVPAVTVEGDKVRRRSVAHPMTEAPHRVRVPRHRKGCQVHPVVSGRCPHAEFVVAEGDALPSRCTSTATSTVFGCRAVKRSIARLEDAARACASCLPGMRQTERDPIASKPGSLRCGAFVEAQREDPLHFSGDLLICKGLSRSGRKPGHKDYLGRNQEMTPRENP